MLIWRKVVAFDFTDQNVFGLNISVDNKVLMRVLNSGANETEQIEPLGNREFLFLAVLVKRNAVYKFHDEIGNTFIGGAAIDK